MKPTTEASPVGERLQKILARAGFGSRRECELLIEQGRVTVDGQAVTRLGTRVDPWRQGVKVDGEKIHLERRVYYLLNKPRGLLTTNSDPSGRPLAFDLLTGIPQRLFSVGRLDKESEGLLLLTNDGELTNRLAHPRYGIAKTYLAQVAGRVTVAELARLRKGIHLSDGRVAVDRVRILGTRGQSTTLEVVLSEGRNREVRRMFARLGHKVMRLNRTEIGPLSARGLAPGQYRKLSGREIETLRRLVQAAGSEHERGRPS